MARPAFQINSSACVWPEYFRRREREAEFEYGHPNGKVPAVASASYAAIGRYLCGAQPVASIMQPVVGRQ